MSVFLDLNDLSLRGGERHQRTYSMDMAPLVLGGADFEVLLPEGVTVTVDRVAGGFLVEVGAKARVYGPCARCLREMVLEVDAAEQEFAPTAKGGWEESDLSAFIENMVLDVGALAREAVILALPPRLLCGPECRGLCPECGKDLNEGPCGCAAPDCDERWGKLSDLQAQEGPTS